MTESDIDIKYRSDVRNTIDTFLAGLGRREAPDLRPMALRTIRRPWLQRAIPPLCPYDNFTMLKEGWEAQPIADQVKVSWKCPGCGARLDAFSSMPWVELD